MVAVQAELIVGAYADPHFGPALVVGIGGGQVEELRDIAICLLPATQSDCRRVLDALQDRRIKLLDEAARAKLALVSGRIAAMAWNLQPELIELDVNPVVLTHGGDVVALDAMMTFTDEAGKCE